MPLPRLSSSASPSAVASSPPSSPAPCAPLTAPSRQVRRAAARLAGQQPDPPFVNGVSAFRVVEGKTEPNVPRRERRERARGLQNTPVAGRQRHRVA